MAKKKKEKEEKEITRKTKLGEIIQSHPEVAQLLFEKYHLHCLGCFAAAFETLEDGAKAHGMGEKEIDQMIGELKRVLMRKSTAGRRVIPKRELPLAKGRKRINRIKRPY